MTVDLTEEHTDNEETATLSRLAGDAVYVFVAVNTDVEPPLIRVVTGGGPQSVEDIELVLSAALNQLRLARS